MWGNKLLLLPLFAQPKYNKTIANTKTIARNTKKCKNITTPTNQCQKWKYVIDLPTYLKIHNIVEAMKRLCQKNLTKFPPPGVTWGQTGTGYHWAAVGGVGQQDERLRLAQKHGCCHFQIPKEEKLFCFHGDGCFKIYFDLLITKLTSFSLSLIKHSSATVKPVRDTS